MESSSATISIRLILKIPRDAVKDANPFQKEKVEATA